MSKPRTRTPPAVATTLLSKLVAEDESLLGDLVEEYAAGRSRAWYWRQVLSALLLGTLRHVRMHPLRALAGVATGWGALLALFFLLGDTTAEAVAGWLWGWHRASAYQTGWWWPYQVTAVFVSYAGFALSALAVSRVHRRQPATLLAYAASLFLALAAGAALIAWLDARSGHRGVRVPHTLFYAVSVALPYHWRSGLLLAPLLVIGVGLLAAPRRRPDSTAI